MNSTSGQQTVYGLTMASLGVIIVNEPLLILPNATLTWDFLKTANPGSGFSSRKNF
jgi:hypothetical protein